MRPIAVSAADVVQRPLAVDRVNGLQPDQVAVQVGVVICRIQYCRGFDGDDLLTAIAIQVIGIEHLHDPRYLKALPVWIAIPEASAEDVFVRWVVALDIQGQDINPRAGFVAINQSVLEAGENRRAQAAIPNLDFGVVPVAPQRLADEFQLAVVIYIIARPPAATKPGGHCEERCLRRSNPFHA